MNNNWLLVSAFIVGTFVIWILFDIWLGANSGPTESQVLREWGKRTIFFPWLIGFLSGHWFFGMKEPYFTAWIYGIGLWGALIAWDIYWWKVRKSEPYFPWYRYPGVWFLVGLPSGMILWGQRNADSPF